MFLSVAIFVAICMAVLVWGSASVRSGFYLSARCRGERSERSVALTFDDGPDPRHTPEVLDVLSRHGVRATFFLIGEKAATHPELVRRIVAEGHVIGNHTHTHSGLFPLLRLRRMLEELQKVGETIRQITGRRPRLFRPPFGVTNPTIRRAVDRRGLTVVGWSIRSWDTVARIPRRKVLDRIVRRLHPGAVILLHDRCSECAWLVERLLEEFERLDYSINTVEQMFDIEAYED